MIKDIIYRWYMGVIDFIVHIRCTAQFYLSPGRVLVNSWIKVGVFTLKKRNYGDDINVPLIESLTGRKVSIKNSIWTTKSNLLCIGSIIDKLGDNNSIIWGSGVLDGNSSISYRPQKVCAVRGRYSRDYLMRFGIDCPEVFGDPALLMPLVFKPRIEKKHRIGVIPHYSDLDNPVVKSFIKENKDAFLIQFANYGSWKEVVCQICSCEAVISSSLHGLILSDAYGIPNVRIVLSDRIGGGDFKFMDYFSGVNRKWEPPINCYEEINLEKIDFALKKYVPINYDNKALLKAFPMELSGELLNQIINNNAQS